MKCRWLPPAKAPAAVSLCGRTVGSDGVTKKPKDKGEVIVVLLFSESFCVLCCDSREEEEVWGSGVKFSEKWSN